MKTKSVPVLFTVFLFGLVALNGEAATDLVINEISPVAPDGDHAWIEIFNPTPEALSLSGLVLRTDVKTDYQLPNELPELGPGAFLIVVFDAADDDDVPFKPTDSDLTFHAPASLVAVWTASSGEVAVYRKRERTKPFEAELIDYVAWGSVGGMVKDKSIKDVWPSSAFVPLAEGFGLYDPDSQISEGASIGLYSGSANRNPEDWVLFDRDEDSKGRRNPVPRPKAFTVADGAEIGSQSFSVGWARRTGDEGYRFQLASDPDFEKVIFEVRTDFPTLRIGENLPEGRYFFRVSAYSMEFESTFSGVSSVDLYDTACDWPLPPNSSTKQALAAWITNPSCSGLPNCRIIKSIEFKFQRKDTPLGCCPCKIWPELGCQWNGPQPFCQKVAFSAGRTPFVFCAGGLLSPHCGTLPFSLIAGLIAEPSRDPVPVKEFFHRLLADDSSLLLEKSCTHGVENCVRASISMIASAYGGACLSQDFIAYVHYLESQTYCDPIWATYDLGHALPMNCEGYSGAECTKMLRWALGLDEVAGANPNEYGYSCVAPSFKQIQNWVDADRPIMTKGRFPHDDYPDLPQFDRLHMRVLSGYCVDTSQPIGSISRTWVYIFDPKTGPRAETYNTWLDHADGTWVAPSSTLFPIGQVVEDPASIWKDSDGDGYADFDQNHRIPPIPCQP